MGRTIISPTTSFTSSFLGGSTSTALPNPATNPEDIFYPFLRPPPDETAEQRVEREQKEAQARKVSEEIDEMLRMEKLALRKRKKPVKVLLLGQSESGKSTTLKNFQMTYARKAWQEEHSSWRAVIQLNLCRTVNFILDILTEEMAYEGALATMSSPGDLVANTPVPSQAQPSSTAADPLRLPETTRKDDIERADADKNAESGELLASPVASPVASPNSLSTPRTPQSPTDTTRLPKLHFDEKHKLLKLKLGPLRRVQRDLEIRLGAGAEEPIPALAGSAMTEAAPFGEASGLSGASFRTSQAGSGAGPNSFFVPPSHRGPQEFYVRSSTGWKAALDRLRPLAGRPSSERGRGGEDDARSKQSAANEAEKTTQVIAECREDIGALWGDEVVKTMLARRRLRLEEKGGFFLNDIDRIAASDYDPSDQDIVRARLRTVGVQEYKFTFEKGLESGQEWLMYDVGGARSLRAAWPPYFDDLTAIIFLAPVSCFDEKLAEDRRVNRLEDSFLIWKAVCENKLLRHTMLTLFLNKCDLLEKKLNAGVQFKNYVQSYGSSRGNDLESVTKYLRLKFHELARQYSPQPRRFFVHLTSVIDTQATAVTLATGKQPYAVNCRNFVVEVDVTFSLVVREGILRDHLRGANLI